MEARTKPDFCGPGNHALGDRSRFGTLTSVIKLCPIERSRQRRGELSQTGEPITNDHETSFKPANLDSLGRGALALHMSSRPEKNLLIECKSSCFDGSLHGTNPTATFSRQFGVVAEIIEADLSVRRRLHTLAGRFPTKSDFLSATSVVVPKHAALAAISGFVSLAVEGSRRIQA